SFSMTCIFALQLVLLIPEIDGCCQSKFVVEFATREDSHASHSRTPSRHFLRKKVKNGVFHPNFSFKYRNLPNTL
ncbi:hypothetical protein, partial [Cronobacter malonaticus]|uniref:hypothetical protein n=1 Tax=Cronobacter malonaticus TaxID=413503 RepID=UPI001F220367